MLHKPTTKREAATSTCRSMAPDLVMGATGCLIRKLAELLKAEYQLQAGVKEQVRLLYQELEGAQAALRKVGQVPWDQLDEQVKLWSRDIRDASYDMDDTIDAVLVRVDGSDCDFSSSGEKGLLKGQVEKLSSFLKKSKARRDISIAIQNIKKHVEELTARHGRFKVDTVVARQATASAVDPRLAAMYTQVNKIVGIDKSSSELMSMLHSSPQQDNMSNTKMKIVSVFGPGGLGKTTLVKVVYDKLIGNYDCSAFVSVGRTPDLKKVIQTILIKLNKQRYMHFNFALFYEMSQFIDELREFLLQHNRYLIVIDDIWETQSWDTIKLAIDSDNSCGGRIIITTRNLEVAKKAGEVYKLQPLPDNDSRMLFYTRMYGQEGGNCVDNQPDHILEKILRKCDGVPLAINTMASVLRGKPREEWSEIYGFIGFGLKNNDEAENTMKIVSLSYYDLPSHLRSCLVYLSAFPEDCVIPKDGLIWKWIAEGFVYEKQGIRSFEIGEGYFSDLLNRSLIEAVESSHDGSICGCRVHDMILDFIRLVSDEENFLTTSNRGYDSESTMTQNIVIRRLALQNSAIGNTRLANHVDMRKARSFIGYECVIEKSVLLLSGFRVLRVLAIENCKPTGGSTINIEHLGKLLHLRYLSLRGTKLEKIPKEIGALRLLQTLDLMDSYIAELPSSISFLTQLLCLRVSFSPDVEPGKEVASVEKLTALEELQIRFRGEKWSTKRLVKELSCLSELKVLYASTYYDKEIERDLLESLPHLPKLHSLKISHSFDGNKIPSAKRETEYALPPHMRNFAVDGVAKSVDELAVMRSSDHVNHDYLVFSGYLGDKFPAATWQGAGFALPRHLRELYMVKVKFHKFPSCISPSCLPNLGFLGLYVDAMDGEHLKLLGRFPELRFLQLISRSSATISNDASDSDAGYFPKLRYCRMVFSTIWFCLDKDGRSLSFHIWNGKDDLVAIPFDSQDMGTIHGGTGTGAPSSSFMPHVQNLSFLVYVRQLRDRCYSDNFGFEHLPLLREIEVEILCTAATAEEVVLVETALRRAVNVHPNRPVLIYHRQVRHGQHDPTTRERGETQTY